MPNKDKKTPFTGKLNIRYIFGMKLRNFRHEKGYGLKELAALTGLSISYINEIEKGKKYPKAEKIMSLADGDIHDIKGHGLGLSYVKKIVDFHKGKIMLESKKGSGTKFYINIKTLKDEIR